MANSVRGALYVGSMIMVLIGAGNIAMAQSQDPSTTVERFHTALIDAMHGGDTLGFEGRRERLSPVIEDTFDLASVSKLTLGKNWQALDAIQRTTFIDKISRLAAVTLASRFTSYSGERFEIVEEKQLESGRRLVRSEFHTGDSVVRIDYALHDSDDQWRILHAWYDGVSGSRIHREEFAAIISREGIEGLMQQLDKKIQLITERYGG